VKEGRSGWCELGDVEQALEVILQGLSYKSISLRGRAALLNQKTGKAVVFDAFLAEIAAHQKRSDPPATQKLPLALRDVLIQDDHGSK
jgi:hypothetical protein